MQKRQIMLLGTILHGQYIPRDIHYNMRDPYIAYLDNPQHLRHYVAS